MIEKLRFELGYSLAIIGVLDTKEVTKYCCIILQKRGKRLKVKTFKKELYSLGEIKDVVKNLPVVLSFLGSKIVYTEENNLYGNNSNQYFSSTYKNNEGRNFSSLVRKDYINQVKQTFQEEKFSVVDIFYGVLEINLVYQSLFNQKQVCLFDITLEYNDNDCVKIKKTTPKDDAFIAIGNEKKNPLEVFLFAVGLSFFNEYTKISKTQNNEFIVKKKELRYKEQFELIAKIGSSFFIITLVINLILSNYYSDKKKNLNNQVYFINNKQMELDRLLKDRERKSKFISISGFLNTNYISFYINEIASELPKNILLNMIHALPNENKITNTNQKILINDRLIRVIGDSRSEVAFNSWLDNLQAKNWIEKISISKYEQKENFKTNFEIEIALK